MTDYYTLRGIKGMRFRDIRHPIGWQTVEFQLRQARTWRGRKFNFWR